MTAFPVLNLGLYYMDDCWKPHVTVAAMIERDGRYLLVEEKTDEGVRLNQPAGHLEAGESLVAAVIREVMEETAFVFSPDCLVGVYRWCRPQDARTYLRFLFGGKVGEAAVPGRRLDEEIIRTVWMTADEIRSVRERHRSPLLEQCLDDWLAGKRCDLGLIRDI